MALQVGQKNGFLACRQREYRLLQRLFALLVELCLRSALDGFPTMLRSYDLLLLNRVQYR
jgi:hypothetical protein